MVHTFKKLPKSKLSIKSIVENAKSPTFDLKGPIKKPISFTGKGGKL